MSRISLGGSALIVGLLAGCASTEVTVPSGPITLTGSYVGSQEGVDAGIPFQDDIIQMTLIHSDDSINGQWEALFVGTGTIGGEVIPSDSILEFSVELIQISPCDGVFAGTAEARVGVRGTGQTTIGISGSYTGSDCDGVIEADFFVQRN